MEWKLKSFDELLLTELYAIMKLRMEVFMLEQKCLYRDLDDLDQAALHQLAVDQGRVYAYSRILILESTAKIQRVVIDKSCRGQGLGFQLMEKNLSYIKTLAFITQVELNAQAHLQDFYFKLGFRVQGEIFFEDNIPHIKMQTVI